MAEPPPDKGWLKRSIESAKRDVKELPDWLREPKAVLPAGPAAPQTPLERRAHEWLRDHAGQEAATVPELQADVLIRDLLAELSRAAHSPSAALRAMAQLAVREHYHCDDSHYCCPQCDHSDHGGQSEPPRACDCGAEAHNAQVAALLGSTESP